MGLPFSRYFPRSRLRLWAVRLALLGLFLQAAAAGFHIPAEQAPAPEQHAAGCLDGQDRDAGEPATPAHAPQHCPFCLVLQGGKLLPPTVCLVFPPTGAAVRIGLPPPPVLAVISLPPSHRPRGPPASA